MQFKSFDMRVSREIREKKGGGENGNHWVRLALEHQCQSQFSFVGWLVSVWKTLTLGEEALMFHSDTAAA